MFRTTDKSKLMWFSQENVERSNENLKNTILKQTKIKSVDSCLRVTQFLSETNLCCEVPLYLLNLWINHYKDAADLLEKTISVYGLNEEDLESYHKKDQIQSCTSLLNRLKELKVSFSFYAIPTKNFFNLNSNNPKFKKSTLKSVENLKFIPVNLHLEQFLVEKSQTAAFDVNTDEERTSDCYEFTSVGAFTTCHTNRQTLMKPIELLMQSDRGFDFTDHQSTFHRSASVIDNEIVLHFYTLKLFIQTLNELTMAREHLTSGEQAKLNDCINEIKSKLEAITDSVIESYDQLLDQFIQIVKTDLKQFYFNLKERLTYFKLKFQAFVIEMNIFQINFARDKFDEIFKKFAVTLVQFYELLVKDMIPDKIDFINKCASFSQGLTTLIASVDMRFYKNTHLTDAEFDKSLNFHLKNGFLFQVESMLSCYSNEYYMVYEHFNTLQSLTSVLFHLPRNRSNLIDTSNFNFYIDIQKSGFHVYLCSSFEEASKAIKVFPILINVGINEQSYKSNLLGANLLQKFVNSQAIIKLRTYFEHVKQSLPKGDEIKLQLILTQLSSNKSYLDSSRPIELLHKFAEATRLMNGLRVTNCKSGKDRTGVSVSLEQCMILVRNHNITAEMTQQILDDFRRYGTRIDVVRKNVGHGKYAFNRIRYYLLPKIYRPPLDLCDELET